MPVLRLVYPAALAFVASFAPSSLVAQSSAPPTASDTNQVSLRTDPIPEIEVLGERPIEEEALEAGIRDIAVSITNPKAPRAQFADPLCLHVQGLGSVLGKRVKDRVEAHARDAGVAVDEPQCTTNALILVVDRPAILIERLRETMPNLFNYQVTPRLRRDAARREPVISWTVEGLRSRFANGAQVNAEGIGAGGFLFENPAANVPTVRETTPSGLRNSFGLARTGAFVIFDVRQLENVHINQLADYATMQLLASPRRQIDYAELAAPSIMTLFSDGPFAAPQGLTQLDRAYLTGLYQMRPTDFGYRLLASVKRANEAMREQATLTP